MYELPPQINTADPNLKALRDYLVRLAQELPESDGVTAAGADIVLPAQGQMQSAEKALSATRALRSLIEKTADEIEAEIDTVTAALSSGYVARSEFGVYTESIAMQMRATARETVESYELDSRLDALSDGQKTVTSAVATLRGEIRRGIITDPLTGEQAMGIAISENLSFTGERVSVGGVEYFTLSPGQTFGLYTASGWQFWINGSKCGWFDSRDGMLHTANLAAENSLFIGGGWTILDIDGFGIRYMGE